MSKLNVDVDKQLAEEYCEKLREIFPTLYDNLGNKTLMGAFVEDRLREEIEFFENELFVDLLNMKLNMPAGLAENFKSLAQQGYCQRMAGQQPWQKRKHPGFCDFGAVGSAEQFGMHKRSAHPTRFDTKRTTDRAQQSRHNSNEIAARK